MHEFVTDIDLETRATSPTSIDLTTATSGRRPAGALVQGPGVIAGKRVASIASIAARANELDWPISTPSAWAVGIRDGTRATDRVRL